MENLQPEILTAKEVALLLKIKKSTVYKLAQEGKIPGRRVVGTHWRFHRDTLLKWVAGELSLNEEETSGG
jgi:excisionase family DNA binding protein